MEKFVTGISDLSDLKKRRSLKLTLLFTFVSSFFCATFLVVYLQARLANFPSYYTSSNYTSKIIICILIYRYLFFHAH
jgi:hypothetical protein